MKTNFFKFVLPLAVVAFGMTSAMNTSSLDKSDAETVPIMGWKHVSGATPCAAVQECSNSGKFDCTALDGSQLYAKPISTCLTPLKRDVQ
ncbi:DUF6520 family protein [Flavobacterium tructae]|uniref:DUF6520 family protein n=1 Tax=Flavobacterium tructae TaxID=1114873 RepID=UPI00255202FB|nr:DUF6520 family protein [Flavobacterium tructae]MDL2141658.1 DUF6520 family protein [Flavobacterium tructae]